MAERDHARTQRLLERIEHGDLEARQELMPLLYEELRSTARSLMARQRLDHTLQTTALVHEAYLRLGSGVDVPQHPRQFAALAATAMRSVLMDYARASRTLKRDGQQHSDFVLEQVAAPGAGEHSLIEVAEAIEELNKIDPELARIAELRIFGGLEHEEIADALGCSLRTLERRWRLARALLERMIEGV
ncbi:MAG: sigma-70 family RNA polymerase sigma factor [Planctomycetaceae bacterium]|nr:sigma-70 family RNA polymerase sigma factor [Planctomycetaceae bacterium]